MVDHMFMGGALSFRNLLQAITFHDVVEYSICNIRVEPLAETTDGTAAEVAKWSLLELFYGCVWIDAS